VLNKKKDNISQYFLIIKILLPLIAVAFGLLIGAIFMYAIGSDPIKAYEVLWNSSFGSLKGFAETLINTTPLIFTGLAVTFAFRTGLFNIGGDGQFLIAYISTAWVGYALELPWIIHIPLALIVGILAGGIWGGFAGYLKAKLGIHEVITTIMMNYISLYFVSFLVGGPLKKPGGILPATSKIHNSAKLLRLMPPSRLNISIILALFFAAIIYYILWKTNIGYELRAVGLNLNAAEYGGINGAKNLILAMFISGALAGLAGSTQVMGLDYRAYQPFGFIGYGFDGIAVALLGKNHPGGVVLAAFLFGILARGSMQMQSMAGVPKEVVEIIQAIIIFFVAAEYVFTILLRKLNMNKGGVVDVN
jgi:general nucleoside transport system permease protein